MKTTSTLDATLIAVGTRQVIAEVAGVNLIDVTDDKTLGQPGIGKTIGEGEYLDLKSKLEKHHEIDIPQEDIPPAEKRSTVTVRQVIDYVRKKIG